eukprot:Gb_39528 [translate_table: standard]
MCSISSSSAGDLLRFFCLVESSDSGPLKELDPASQLFHLVSHLPQQKDNLLQHPCYQM